MPQGALHNRVSNKSALKSLRLPDSSLAGTHCGIILQQHHHHHHSSHHHQKWGSSVLSQRQQQQQHYQVDGLCNDDDDVMLQPRATTFLSRMSPSLPSSLSSSSSSSLVTFISCLVLVITSTSLINCVYCDDGSLGPEITTEFGKFETIFFTEFCHMSKTETLHAFIFLNFIF